MVLFYFLSDISVLREFDVNGKSSFSSPESGLTVCIVYKASYLNHQKERTVAAKLKNDGGSITGFCTEYIYYVQPFFMRDNPDN